MITGDWIKKGAVVIDVGINRVAAPERGEGKFRLTGDVVFDSASQSSCHNPGTRRGWPDDHCLSVAQHSGCGMSSPGHCY